MPLAFEGSELLYQLCKGQISKTLQGDWHRFYDRNSKEGLINRLKLIMNITIPIYDIHNTNKYVLVDFKPNNVMITANGKISMIDLDSVQIVDGSVKYLAPAFTVEYLPPELQNSPDLGKRTLDVTCDLFSMAVVFYQLLYGIHPFMVSVKDSQFTELCQNIRHGYFPFGSHSSKIAVIPPPHRKFTILPDEIKTLFVLAFENNPAKRPVTGQWGEVMYRFLSPLVKK
jgi:DNA-binding helix-hairpin-helix protein with protein kinase domain